MKITTGDEPFHVGDTYTYDCKPGYELTTTDIITCGSDGTWSPQPRCTEG